MGYLMYVKDALPFKKSLKLVGKDIMRAGFGLAVSLVLALN